MPSRWSFARRHMLDTFLEQYVGRLSHDRTTERHWQRLGSHSPERGTPWFQHTRGSPRHVSWGSCCAIIVSFLGGWSGRHSLGPLPLRTACRRHLRIAPTAQYRRRCARRLGLVRPRDPSWCPVTLFRRAARCWPSAGLLVGGQVACHQVTPRMWSAIAGAQGTGACSRLSPPVPGPLGGRGHTCRTPPWACSISSQSGATRN